ncbi:hypothetical protein AQPW35_53590 [Rubrivivax pictus]|uniref:Uncharacterized protein n=1 Tax=Pseudaquabacterium pictum TaxID=2315236 RepID=A0A480B5C3_9BURK|nr:hypothetical protein AQPW35_53590 [Rubrivivax pictus]
MAITTSSSSRVKPRRGQPEVPARRGEGVVMERRSGVHGVHAVRLHGPAWAAARTLFSAIGACGGHGRQAAFQKM